MGGIDFSTTSIISGAGRKSSMNSRAGTSPMQPIVEVINMANITNADIACFGLINESEALPMYEWNPSMG